MNRLATMTMAAVVAGLAGLTAAQAMTDVFFWDDFNDNTQDYTAWGRWEITAKLTETGGRLWFYRDPENADVNQYGYLYAENMQRKYNQEDTLLTRATVRAPHKVLVDGKSYQVGIGVEVNNSWFVDLMVEDSSVGRRFVTVHHDASGHSIIRYFDAPEYLNSYDLTITYSTKKDAFRFYWSEVGSATRYQLGGGVTDLHGFKPRILLPLAQGYIYGDVLLPASWKVSVDNFYVHRVNAP